MAEPVMCCGGTCVRAVCEYHKDVPLEAAPETRPSDLRLLPPEYVGQVYWDAVAASWRPVP